MVYIFLPQFSFFSAAGVEGGETEAQRWGQTTGEGLSLSDSWILITGNVEMSHGGSPKPPVLYHVLYVISCMWLGMSLSTTLVERAAHMYI